MPFARLGSRTRITLFTLRALDALDALHALHALDALPALDTLRTDDQVEGSCRPDHPNPASFIADERGRRDIAWPLDRHAGSEEDGREQWKAVIHGRYCAAYLIGAKR